MVMDEWKLQIENNLKLQEDVKLFVFVKRRVIVYEKGSNMK